MRILYLMHVDWDWIKQRPHFLAEHLSAHFDVTVGYPFSRHRRWLRKNPRQGLRLIPLVAIPFKYECPHLYRLNRLYQRMHIRILIRRLRPHVIWLTHPYWYDIIPHGFEHRIVYDCMDDHQSLSVGRPFAKALALKLEQQLLARSDIVFVSSENLAEVLNRRQPCAEKTILIRNAYEGRLQPAGGTRDTNGSSPYKVAYFGTVASWIDFDALLHCLDQIDDIEFIIIGPRDGKIDHRPHDRLKFVGPVPQADLATAISDCNCLIMPFRVNELIRSVDPVKLYEYINFNKPIVSVYYDEVARFGPFVEFYNDEDELVGILTQLKRCGWSPKYSEEIRISFLRENNWEVRSLEIVECLERLCE